MTQEELKTKRMEYLSNVFWQYTITEPQLSMEDVAIVLSEMLPDDLLKELIKKYKKEIKRS